MAQGILQNAFGCLRSYPVRVLIHQVTFIPWPLKSCVKLESTFQATLEHMDTYLNQEVSVVITVCDHADQACPTFPGNPARYHWPFQDPAKAEESDEEIIVVFRRVRDQIRLIFDMYGAGFVDGLTSQAASAASSG